MSIKDDMPFLAKVYETATPQQREEIRKILGIKTPSKCVSMAHNEDITTHGHCLECQRSIKN